MPRGRSPTFTDFTTSPLRDVDDVDAVGFLGAHVEPAAVGAPHRVLGILAAHPDALDDRPASPCRSTSTVSFSSIAADSHLPSGDR